MRHRRVLLRAEVATFVCGMRDDRGLRRTSLVNV